MSQTASQPSIARVVVLVVALGAGVGVWLSRNPQPIPLPPVPAIDGSTHVNANMHTQYVGTQACVQCHQEQYDSYLQTMHSRSLNRIDVAEEPSLAEFRVPAKHRLYRTYRKGDSVHHREMLEWAAASPIVLSDYPVQYVVGSGHYSKTYLAETAGFLIESPLTWYRSLDDWALSPGYEDADIGFARPVYFECLFCHAGHVEPAPETLAKMTIHEHAIGCERCHGPGEFHVQRHSKSSQTAAGPDLTIVNPAKLSRARNESVCMQCHLTGKASVDIRDRHIQDYRPGLLFSDFRVEYGAHSSNDRMTVVGHVEQMRASACYQQTDDLTCTTCHNPHARPTEADHVDVYRAKCLTCHSEPDPCGLPHAKRIVLNAQDDCVNCHMPKSETEILHVAATHHRIGIYADPFLATPETTAGPVELVPIDDLSRFSQYDQDRCLGLAYLHLSLQEEDPGLSGLYRNQALAYLSDVLPRDPIDADVLASLAAVHQRHEPQQSQDYAERALQQADISPSARVRALFALSDSLREQGLTEEAIEPLEELVTLRRQGADWYLLAACCYQAGDFNRALEAARKAVEIMPDRIPFRELLAELYSLQGHSKHADEQRDVVRALQQLPSQNSQSPDR